MFFKKSCFCYVFNMKDKIEHRVKDDAQISLTDWMALGTVFAV